MAIVRQNPAKKWMPVVGAAAATVVALVWWSQDHVGTGSNSPQGDGPAATAQRTEDAPSAFDALNRAPAPEAPTNTMAPATPEQQQAAQVAMTEQAKANQALERSDVWKPLTSVRERPPFASLMEWQMLKGVAERNANPQAELLRLTNFLRYNKLLEKWQDLPAGSEPALRQALARQLVDELPDRVRAGEVDAKDARGQAPALLRDGYGEGAARAKVEATLLSRLQEAADAQHQSAATNGS